MAFVADPQATGRRSFPGVGRNVARGPYAASWFEFWFDTIRRSGRAAFAEAYDPWAAGEEPKYFAK